MRHGFGRRCVILTALLGFFMLGLPQSVHADGTDPLLPAAPAAAPGGGGGGAAAGAATADEECHENVQDSLNARAQERTVAGMRVYTGVPALDISVMYCLSRIMSLFNIIGTIGDPLGIVWSIISNLITQLINQICQAALSAINQVINTGLSYLNKFCIPIPGLGLNFNVNLGLQGAEPCNGVPLITARAGMYGPGVPMSPWWQIWNVQPR